MSTGLKVRVTELLEEELENRANKMRMVAMKTKGPDRKEGTIHEVKQIEGNKDIKKKTIMVMPDNYHKYLLISDSLELSFIFYNYLAMQERSEDPVEFTNSPV